MISFVVHGSAAPQGSKNQFGAEANPRTRPWRAAVTAEAARAADGQPLMDGPVAVRAVFHFARPKAHYRTGKHNGELRGDAPHYRDNGPDLDKLCRAIGDSLTGTVIRDDRQITSWSALKVWGDRDYADISIYSARVRSAA